MVTSAGLSEVEITWKAAVFDGAPQSTAAAKFGTQGVNLCARKPRG